LPCSTSACISTFAFSLQYACCRGKEKCISWCAESFTFQWRWFDLTTLYSYTTRRCIQRCTCLTTYLPPRKPSTSAFSSLFKSLYSCIVGGSLFTLHHGLFSFKQMIRIPRHMMHRTLPYRLCEMLSVLRNGLVRSCFGFKTVVIFLATFTPPQPPPNLKATVQHIQNKLLLTRPPSGCFYINLNWF
jgi:hypothetical protein